MPQAIWIDDERELEALARRLRAAERIGVDTEFLRERTYFPQLCLLQIECGGDICCVDALAMPLAALVPTLDAPAPRKLIHAARQDLEALHRATGRIATPIFDTQIAAACAGLKPQIGYAELAHDLLGVDLDKAHTRTDWSRRPLSPEQLSYAADDVRYLDEIAAALERRLRELDREHWVREDCAALADPRLYEPDPACAWERLGGIARLEPRARTRARAIAAWRERTARERNRPRAWILPDAAVYEIAQSDAASPRELARLPAMRQKLQAALAEDLLAALARIDPDEPCGSEPVPGAAKSAAEKAAIERMVRVLDARAAELGLRAEVLATRAQIRSLATGAREVGALAGWRRAVIGERLLAVLE